MILKETLAKVVRLQREELNLKETGVERELLKSIDLKSSHAVILSGIRRCGKSTLLRQLMKRVKNPNYFNFEDLRAVNFEASDFEKLGEVFSEENGGDTYFFDEIQVVSHWEKFIRHLLDLGKKCVITGSNASLLSKELGTLLTGRHLTHELFPFSYNETLHFLKNIRSPTSFGEYLKYGGFPEFLKYLLKKEIKIEILQEFLNDIVVRDVAARYAIKDVRRLKEMVIYLLTNAGKNFSYNKLAKYFNLGSVHTMISYINFLEDSYLLFTVPSFGYSLKKQIINNKKIYGIDTGLSNANSIAFSSDAGRILENLVFLHLRRWAKEIYYYRGEKECDFIFDKWLAIQVCYKLNEENKKRELEGLKEAVQKLHRKERTGIIVTFNQQDTLGGFPVMRAYDWLCSNPSNWLINKF